MGPLTREEYRRRFVDYMTSEAGFEYFNDGRSVLAYAETAAAVYWDHARDIDPEQAAESDIDCWEDE